MITASAVERALACPGSFALPEARTTNAYAEEGTANHAEHEQAIEAGVIDEPIARILGDAARTVRAEVKVAFDVSSGQGRILGYGSDRGYVDLAPFEIPGTLDLLAYDAERVYVGDHKLHALVTPARSNLQIGFGALAAARALGKEEATVFISYEHGRPDVATLDMVELDAIAWRLRGIHGAVASQKARRARGELVEVSEGRHCKHCPAIHACPAKVALIKRLANGGEANELELMMPLSSSTARAAYDRIQQADNVLKRAKAALYAYASETPIPLGDGRFFGRHTKRGTESLDGRIAQEVVRQFAGDQAAADVVEISVTKTAIKEAAKATAAKGKAAEMERAILAEIRARNGATRGGAREVVEEYTATLEIADKAS